MKKLTVVLLSVIFTTLIIGHIQLISADHLEPGLGIFKNEKAINTISTEDSKYQIYVRVEIRNVQGELISITETTRGIHIAHEITDYTFNEKLGEKEIITIDNIKYEKVKYSGKPDMKQLIKIDNRPSHFIGSWHISLCTVIGNHGYTCVAPFQVSTAFVSLVEDNVVENHWTILRTIT